MTQHHDRHQRKRFNKKTKKKLIALAYALVILAGIVGARSWRDLVEYASHMQDVALQPKAPAAVPVLRTPEDVARLERSMNEATIFLGDFTTEGDDVRFTPSGIAASELTDSLRINFLFTVHGLPADMTQLTQKIADQIRLWRAEDNKEITEVILDYRPATPDYNALEGLARDLRQSLRHDYAVGLVLNRAWFEKDENAVRQLGNVSKYVRTYYVDITKSVDAAPTVAAAIYDIDRQINMPFSAFAGPDVNAEQLWKDLNGSTQFFVGLMTDATLPPVEIKPQPKAKEKKAKQ